MKAKILEYISKWESQGYAGGIPDEAPSELEALKLVPSYRMICRAIMRNDTSLTTLGYARPQTDSYVVLKRIEIAARKKA